MKAIEDGNRRNTSLESEIKNLMNDLDNERRKSMLDEEKIGKLEDVLAKKLAEAQKKDDDLRKLADKVNLTNNEVNFLKDKLDDERRKSQLDLAQIDKLEKILGDKERELEDAEAEFLNRDKDIGKLEKMLDDERRKSMLDEDKIDALEKELDKKYKEAADNYNKYLAMQRKSDLTADELEKLKGEIEDERRKTLADKENLLRKLNDIESDKQTLKNKIKNGEVELGKMQQYADDIENKNKNLRKAYDDAERRSSAMGD